MAVVAPDSIHQSDNLVVLEYESTLFGYNAGADQETPEIVLNRGIWSLRASLVRMAAFAGTALEFQLKHGLSWQSLQINLGRTGGHATSTTMPDGGMSQIRDVPGTSGAYSPGEGFPVHDQQSFRGFVASGGTAGFVQGVIALKRVG